MIAMRPPTPLDQWSGSRHSKHFRGKTADGAVKKHNEIIHLIDWDCIILDEYHFVRLARLRPRAVRPDR